MEGVFHRLRGQRCCHWGFICLEPLGGHSMVQAKVFAGYRTARIGARCETGRVEDHSSQSAASAFSNQSSKLYLWRDAGAFWGLHALGLDRAGARVIFVCVCWNTGSIRAQNCSWESYPRVIEYWIWGGAFVTTAVLLAVLGRIAHRAIAAFEGFGNGPR